MNPFAFLGALTPRAWKVIGLLAAGVMLIIAVLAWGDSRYDAGVQDTDAKWKQASEKLARAAAKSGQAADAREAQRIRNHASRVADEKEKIDEAVASGASPLDVLFGGG